MPQRTSDPHNPIARPAANGAPSQRAHHPVADNTIQSAAALANGAVAGHTSIHSSTEERLPDDVIDGISRAMARVVDGDLA